MAVSNRLSQHGTPHSFAEGGMRTVFPGRQTMEHILGTIPISI